jgi:hypothetical protein
MIVINIAVINVGYKQELHTEFLLKYYKELIPGSGRPLEKLKSTQPVNKFPVYYGPRRLITVFTRSATCNSWVSWIQYMPNHSSPQEFLMLYSRSDLIFLQAYSPNPCTHFSSPSNVLHALLISFFFISQIILDEGYESWGSTLLYLYLFQINCYPFTHLSDFSKFNLLHLHFNPSTGIK